MAFTLFGLTGGIACGKSTVAGFLRNRHLPVIDADEVAREVVSPGSEGLAHIVAVFGPGVLDASGCLDRSKMGTLVFTNDKERAKLEAITHPLIRQQTQRRARALADQGHPMAAYEAALLVENGLADAFRPLVVVVVVDPATQVARLVARNSLTEEQARARIASQMPLSEKASLADHVIDTGVSLEEVRARTDVVLGSLCNALRIERSRYGLE
jgi:dephospho-CoA kinase